MNQTWENGPILARLAQIYAPKSFFVGFISIRCWALSQAIIICNFKENVWSKPNKITKNLILGLI